MLAVVSFFTAVYATAQYAKRRYYFTATPKTGRGVSVARGMNNTDVYGGVLENVPAQELIKQVQSCPQSCAFRDQSYPH